MDVRGRHWSAGTSTLPAMSILPSWRRAVVVLAAGTALGLSACSGSSGTAAPTAGSAGSVAAATSSAPGAATSAAKTSGSNAAPGKLDPAAAAPPASFSVKAPSDPCAVLKMDDVKMFTLGKATTIKAAPPNGCLYLNAGGDVVFLYRLSTKEQLPGGLESLRNGASSAMGAPATGIMIRGFSGFVVTGSGTGTLETQMAVTVGDYVLECSVPKGGDLSDQRSITGEAIATILDTIVTVN